MHLTSYKKMALFVNQYLDKEEKIEILDIGSQDINGSYRPLFEEKNWKYTGSDMVAGNNVDIVLDNVYNWKQIKSNTYDVVVSGQVFEHVEYFWITMLEIVRIMKPGGKCCIIAPSNGFEHRYPVDCWRFYPDGFKALAKYADVETLDVYTAWDDENQWKDSVLIFYKPKWSLVRKLKNNLKRYILKKII